MTSGGRTGTNGGRRTAVLTLALFAAVTLAIAAVNSLTTIDDHAALGRPVAPWEPWVWELTSAAFWIAALLPLIALMRRLRPARAVSWRGWAAALAALALLSMPVAVAHFGWMLGSRALIYAALGDRYAEPWSWAKLVYEWRKDLVSVLIIAAIGVAVDHWRRDAAGGRAAPPPTPPFRLEVRDGARVRWFAPAEIERVEAAGNYVELHTAHGLVLHRATLAATEALLADHGFARVHRSRLVRTDAVIASRATTAGDVALTLASGATVLGSRRYRERA